ncbi:MAG: hypothetical protein WBG86_08925 [Polyangiales bacterium]
MSDQGGDSPADGSEVAAHWGTFCDRMKTLGERILGDGFPEDPQGQTEGIRHLTRMVTLGLNLFVECDDPEFPRFLRHNDDITQWGGNNPDNTYLYARVDAGSEYKIYGNARGTLGFIVSVRDGFMHQGDEAVVDLSSDEIEVDADGAFELTLSAEERPGNWLRMLQNATQVGIRVYFDDWERPSSPVFHIVKVGNEGRSPPLLGAEQLSRTLDDAARWVEDNLVYWNEWLKQRLPFLPVNAISPPMQVAGGSNEVITYAGGRLDLGANDALVLTIEPLQADYVGLVYYTQSWFETGDLANRTTSLNRNQLHVDDDDRIRIVVCRTDPGHVNWLDTEDRPTGLLVMRTLNGDTAPTVTADVMPKSKLRTFVPASTPWLSEDERRAQIMARREHIARRFHG